MRQGPNGRRPRGRPNRKQHGGPSRPNTFDSNGPDGRIRGNAHQVFEKYIALARDGVTCSLCHQIAPDNLGKPESFSGGFLVGEDREIYGPHDDVFANGDPADQLNPTPACWSGTIGVDCVAVDDMRSVSVGFNHTCAIDNGDTVWCWGSNGSGRLGELFHGAGRVFANVLSPRQAPTFHSP